MAQRGHGQGGHGDPGRCPPRLPPAAGLQAGPREARSRAVFGVIRAYFGVCEASSSSTGRARRERTRRHGSPPQPRGGWEQGLARPHPLRGGPRGADPTGGTLHTHMDAPHRAPKAPRCQPHVGPPPRARPPQWDPAAHPGRGGGGGGLSASYPFGDGSVHGDGVTGALLDDQVHVVVLQDGNHFHLHGPSALPAAGRGWGARPHSAKRRGGARPHAAKRGGEGGRPHAAAGRGQAGVRCAPSPQRDPRRSPRVRRPLPAGGGAREPGAAPPAAGRRAPPPPVQCGAGHAAWGGAVRGGFPPPSPPEPPVWDRRGEPPPSFHPGSPYPHTHVRGPTAHPPRRRCSAGGEVPGGAPCRTKAGLQGQPAQKAPKARGQAGAEPCPGSSPAHAQAPRFRTGHSPPNATREGGNGAGKQETSAGRAPFFQKANTVVARP